MHGAVEWINPFPDLWGWPGTHCLRMPINLREYVYARIFRAIYVTKVAEREARQKKLLDECLAYLASGSDPTVPRLELASFE